MQWGEKLINSRHTIRGTDGHGEVNHSDNSTLHIRTEQGTISAWQINWINAIKDINRIKM